MKSALKRGCVGVWRVGAGILGVAGLVSTGHGAPPMLNPGAASSAQQTAVRVQRSVAAAAATPTATSNSQSLFSGGALAAGVSNWSWNLCNTSLTATVGAVVALVADECRGSAWSSGAYLHLDKPAANATALKFDIFLGPTPTQTVNQIYLGFGSGTTGAALARFLTSPKANAWNSVNILLATQLNGQAFQDIWLMNSAGNPKFYLNNIMLTLAAATPPAAGSAVTITVDATADKHAISPLVYGVAAFDNTATVLKELNSPINRYGGNTSSSYNWKLNASNHADDWFYESLGENGGATEGGQVTGLVAANRLAQAQSMVTVPMLDWGARLGPNRSALPSYSVAKYGAQKATDSQWMPDAGNGVRTDGSLITNNDPNDANTPVDENFQRGLLQLLMQKFGAANQGGVSYYLLDNEHSIWHETHRDTHPAGASMDEVLSRIRRYASMIRSTDPGAQIVGPEESGWTGYFFSGKDQQSGNWTHPADRSAHGGMDYVPWLLQQIRQSEQSTGTRLLDVFSLHYYPQSNEYSSDVSQATQLLRNQSTRSLWDPAYTDKSWIADKVMLIPRMKSWVSQYAPGLKIALTEYSWGADQHINGATAQADVLGILGREGVDIATRWTAPSLGSPTFKAFQMYRNYDGQMSAFGDQSVKASVPDPDQLSAFAAVRSSDGALTVMVINKDLNNARPISLKLSHFGNGSGASQRWQLTSSNQITASSQQAYTGAQINDKVPAQSITLYVIH